MNIISEILRNNWLIHSESLENYGGVANALLKGDFRLNKEKASRYNILCEEEYYKGEVVKKNKVAVISMINEMTKYNTECSLGAEGYKELILEVMEDSEIKGIVLFLDGPGGNADAIPVFQSIKPYIKKPIIALVDKACSLHYWVASILSEHIMLNNNFMAECGSIGAMVIFEKPKNEIVIIRPEESKDKNQELVEALEGNYNPIKERLSILAQRFQKEVKDNRPQINEEALFGKTYLGQNAIDMGLADSIGDMEKAYQLVLTKAELSNI